MHGSKIPWVKVNGFLTPDIPPHVAIDIDRAWLALKALRVGALGAFWTFDWDTTPTDWWHVICDDAAYDLDRIPSAKVRWTIRASLARTEVRRVERDWLADHGYDLYLRAAGRYGGHQPRTRDGYQDTVLKTRVHPGDLPWEFWGVFTPDDRLVASANLRLQGECAVLSSATFDPDARGVYPMNALYYSTVRHYLRERGFRYVASGSRPILHETHVEDFRLRMGWRTCYSRLGALVLPPIGACVSAYHLLRPAVIRVLPRIPRGKDALRYADGMVELRRIAAACAVPNREPRTGA